MSNADKMNDEMGDVNIYVNLFGGEAYDSCNYPAYTVNFEDAFEVGVINSDIVEYCGSDSACF